ncbi:MAG: hypothetical protein Q7V01_02070 [Vicinamibacterales bacterium]|nr:hypothetical protein [Vicinamibacterales bacterium]
MRSLVLRSIVVLAAVAAMGGAAFKVWDIEQQAAVERDASDAFERQARQLTRGLAELRVALQAYVADGQIVESWQKTAADLHDASSAQAAALRELTRSPEGQGAVEGALEGVASLARTETRAREFLASAQRLSASDVVFSEGGPQIARVVTAVDTARGHESIYTATRLEAQRVQQLTWLGGAAAVAFCALLLLVPVRRVSAASDLNADDDDAQPGSGLGIGHISPAHGRPDHAGARAGNAAIRPERQAAPGTADAQVISLAATADLCSALARVQEPRELPALLEQAAKVLHAEGIVVWMPDGPGGMLRPALAQGYSPLTITRMGLIALDADNATAEAYRTRATQCIPPEGGQSGAVAAPLVTAEGCSGVMATEIKAGTPVEPARAAAAIIAAQLSMLISPTSPPPSVTE